MSGFYIYKYSYRFSQSETKMKPFTSDDNTEEFEKVWHIKSQSWLKKGIHLHPNCVLSVVYMYAFCTVGLHFDMCPYYMCAVNVVAMLHNFWEHRQMSQSNGSSSESDGSVGDTAIQTESLLLYESAPSPGPPYVCYVTLPGGSCFGNYKVCLSSSALSAVISTLDIVISNIHSMNENLHHLSFAWSRKYHHHVVSTHTLSNISKKIFLRYMMQATFLSLWLNCKEHWNYNINCKCNKT